MIEIMVHVVWSTHLRKRVLVPAGDAEVSRCIEETARGLRCAALAVGNASEHVHVVARLDPSIALATFVQRVKGVSARVLRVTWQRHYWAESVTPTEVDSLLDYVRQQRWRHDNSHPHESWQFASPT